MRRQFAVACTVISIAFGAVGCSDSVSPVVSADDAVAKVVIASDSATYTTTTYSTTNGNVVWIRFKFDVTVTNVGKLPFHYEFCASSVEQETNADWKTAWSPICAVEGGAPSLIAPGQTVTQTVDVGASISGSSQPDWKASSVAGVIRYSAGIAPAGYLGLIPRRVSNSIRLVPTL